MRGVPLAVGARRAAEGVANKFSSGVQFELAPAGPEGLTSSVQFERTREDEAEASLRGRRTLKSCHLSERLFCCFCFSVPQSPFRVPQTVPQRPPYPLYFLR